VSTSNAYTVWCDIQDCQQWSVGFGIARTASEVRREAKAEGWGRRKGEDLCPHHNDHRPERREAQTRREQ
jgi:hypothetical protein